MGDTIEYRAGFKIVNNEDSTLMLASGALDQDLSFVFTESKSFALVGSSAVVVAVLY